MLASSARVPLILGMGYPMTDDVMFEVAGALSALKVTTERHSFLAREVKITLRDRIAEGEAAVARSRALLNKLNARKPPSFL